MADLTEESAAPAAPTDPGGPTGTLCTWLAETQLTDVPPEVQERAKHLILDGIGCLLLGSHLEWSALGTEAVTDFDRGGEFLVVASGRSTSAFSAAALNSSFIQGFEFDDYFPGAPLHSNSIVLPAMLPVIQQRQVSGAQLLLATILGYEVGTRVGLSLHGPEMLTRGWHSGAVFGGPAAAASAGRLLGLTAAAFEDAIGIAATQSAGLMSAQFESMVKRMQHGFASRNGLYGAVLAASGYVGIKRVFERGYGSYLDVYGEGHSPDATQIALNLGSTWNTSDIAVKPYAAMGALHAGIDAALTIRGPKPIDAKDVASIKAVVGVPAYQHGGFDITQPIQPVTAQMSLKYSVCVALLDGQALLQQYASSRINQPDVWGLIDVTTVTKDPSYDQPPHTGYTTDLTVTFKDGSTKHHLVETPTGGVDHPLSNDDIVKKFRSLTGAVTTEARAQQLLDTVLNLDTLQNAGDLLTLLTDPVKNPLA